MIAEAIKNIEINNNFQKSVNLMLDLDNFDRVRSYIPTASANLILKRYLAPILGESHAYATSLIGPYGKGKSHLLLVLLNILDGNADKICSVIKKFKALDDETGNMLAKIQDTQKRYLPVLISTAGVDLNQAFVLSLREALIREGLQNIAPESYFSEALEKIEIWEKKYPRTFEQLDDLLKGVDINDFKTRLASNDPEALLLFRRLYPSLTAGDQFDPIKQLDCMKIYQQVLRLLTENLGYSGIYVVFDEFSKYVEGHPSEGFAQDMDALQKMVELSNSSRGKLITTLVAHKPIREYDKTIDQSVKNIFRGIEGRIDDVEFIVSAQTNYELIADSVHKKSGFEEAYGKLLKSESYTNKRDRAYELPCFSRVFPKKEYDEILAKGCFPLTTLSAYALLHISEKVAQNERTVFTFMADTAQGSLSWLIQKRPDSLINVSSVYDYFRNLFKENADLPLVHTTWLKAEYALSKTEDENSARLIKSLAIVQMIGNEADLPAGKTELMLASDLEPEIFDKTLQMLQDSGIILFRSGRGIYDFRSNVGVDLDREIHKKEQELEKRINPDHILEETFTEEFVLPKRYNQEFSMTRYFRYRFLDISAFDRVAKSSFLFEDKFSDGIVILVTGAEDSDVNRFQDKLIELNDERLVCIWPKQGSGINNDKLLRYQAIRALEDDHAFINENEPLKKELSLYRSDLLEEINNEIKNTYFNWNTGVTILGSSETAQIVHSAKEFNSLLSTRMELYYARTPKVNHELVNVETIGTQYKKARNTVVQALLEDADLNVFRTGTKPEAMVFRSAIETPIKKNDPGYLAARDRIMDFFGKCDGDRHAFSELYEILQGKEFGVRRGVIPLFIAKALQEIEGSAVIYLGRKEMEVTADTLNNVNEFPDKYELYIEPNSSEKDKYLKELEDLFCVDRNYLLSKQSRISGIVSCMQKWYRTLPQYSRVSRNYSCNEMVSGIMDQLRRMEINPREFLFDKIPALIGKDSFEDIIHELASVKREVDKKFKLLVDRVADVTREEFGAKGDDNLKAVLQDWLSLQNQAVKKKILNSAGTEFINYISELQTNNNEEIVRGLAKRVNDIYLEDWNDDSVEEYRVNLKSIVEEVESAEESNLEENNKIILQDMNGQSVERYFDADISDSSSQYLKNMIDDAIEQFDGTVETNQIVAILAKEIQEILSRN